MTRRGNGFVPSSTPQNKGFNDVIRGLNDIEQAMEQQVNLNKNAPLPLPPPNQQNEVVRRFIGQNPEPFKGNVDPLVVKDWLDKIEKIFNLLEVNDKDKLTLEVYKLEGEATRWWEMTRRSRNDG
ncbi:hypothetical protein MKX01_039650 [Papaver californicum]|nr:hypothetical protein MKX01_039650 [Papaver californicum]